MTQRDVEHTPDGRWIVVDGRRWRRQDPGLPEDVARVETALRVSDRQAVEKREAARR